jgi:hypothetical protein
MYGSPSGGSSRAPKTGWHRHEADYVVVSLADGELLVCAPADKLPMAQRYNLEYLTYSRLDVRYSRSRGNAKWSQKGPILERRAPLQGQRQNCVMLSLRLPSVKLSPFTKMSLEEHLSLSVPVAK